MSNEPKYKVVLTHVPPDEPEPLPGEIWQRDTGDIVLMIEDNMAWPYRYIDLKDHVLCNTEHRSKFVRKIGTLKVENI